MNRKLKRWKCKITRLAIAAFSRTYAKMLRGVEIGFDHDFRTRAMTVGRIFRAASISATVDSRPSEKRTSALA